MKRGKEIWDPPFWTLSPNGASTKTPKLSIRGDPKIGTCGDPKPGRSQISKIFSGTPNQLWNSDQDISMEFQLDPAVEFLPKSSCGIPTNIHPAVEFQSGYFYGIPAQIQLRNSSLNPAVKFQRFPPFPKRLPRQSSP